MEINVKGSGSVEVTPDFVGLGLEFTRKSKSYDEVLALGVASVEDFITKILLPNGFQKEEMETRSFVIRESYQWDAERKKRIPEGFEFTQQAMLGFDYDKTKLSKIMAMVAELEHPPVYMISFGLKDEEKYRQETLTKAFIDAKSQAEVIAQAAGLQLARCARVDFRPIAGTNFMSESALDGSMLRKNKAVSTEEVAQTVNNVFTPSDIEVKEDLYCLWVAE